MTRSLTLLALIPLLGLVCTPDAVLAGPKPVLVGRENALAKRHYPGWEDTTVFSPDPTAVPGPGGGPATGGGGGAATPPVVTDGGSPGGGETPPATPDDGSSGPGGGGAEGTPTVIPTATEPGAGGGTPAPTETGTGGGSTGTPVPSGGTRTSTGGGTGPTGPTFTQSIDTNAPSFTQSLPPAPTSGSLSTNVTVPTNGEGIFYTGGTWLDSDSCDENTKVTRDIGGQMDCSFLGTAIYMSTVVGPFSGFYTATIDGETVVVDAYRNISEPVCEVSWSRWGLENTTHVVSVVFRGSSVLAGPDTTGNSSLEITRFTVTTEGATTGSSAGQGNTGGDTSDAAGGLNLGSTLWTVASALGIVGALWM